MKRETLSRFHPLLALLAAAALGAAGPADVEGLLRQGYAAYLRGDWAAAAACYERAGVWTTDPARVTLSLAAVRYRQAREAEDGRGTWLREAEQNYRCGLDTAEPWRAEALYGLGTCLLRKAERGDRGSARYALECFEQCLREARPEPALAEDVRHNLQRARLMAAQAGSSPAAPEEPPPGEAGDADSRPPEPPAPDQASPQEMAAGKEGPEGGASPVAGDKAQAARQTDRPPAPGAGNLPPIPDREDLPPLSPQDAARHLEQAARRILDEERTRRQGVIRPPAPGVRDW